MSSKLSALQEYQTKLNENKSNYYDHDRNRNNEHGHGQVYGHVHRPDHVHNAGEFTTVGHSRLNALANMRDSGKEAYEARVLARMYRPPPKVEQSCDPIKNNVVSDKSFEEQFPSLDSNATPIVNSNLSWNKKLTFDGNVKAPVKFAMATKPTNNQFLDKKSAIFFMEDRMQICQDLLDAKRLDKPLMQSKKMPGPDENGFRTVINKKTVAVKTNY